MPHPAAPGPHPASGHPLPQGERDVIEAVAGFSGQAKTIIGA